jgi:hypothetical protein
MASSSTYTKAGLDAAFGALRQGPQRSKDHRDLLSDLLPAQAGSLNGTDVFPMPEVDNMDAFERQVVEYVKPNHGTCRETSRLE